jgi:5-methylcytosine-specific restriction endonuclease McrA
MNAREYSNRLADLLAREHGAMADFLVALADFDRQKLWRELDYTSLWYYLHRELGLSKGGATFRKAAVELVQRYPEVVEPLRDGRLCISSVVELARVITPENRAVVLPRFFHRSFREAKVLSAELKPAAVVPQRDVVTMLRAPALAESTPRELDLHGGAVMSSNIDVAVQAPEPNSANPGEALATLRQDAASRTAPEFALAAPPTRRDPVEPLAADAYRLHLTVSRKVMDKIEAARDALSHSRPNASLEEILEAGLDLVLAAQAKRNGLVEKPLKTPRASTGDHIPAHVRREVWKRDEGRCQWSFESGEICGSTYMVEVDHLHPKALGGAPTVENCRLACFGHNQLHARRAFGDAHIDEFARERSKPPRAGEEVAAYAGARADGSADARAAPRPDLAQRTGDAAARPPPRSLAAARAALAAAALATGVVPVRSSSPSSSTARDLSSSASLRSSLGRTSSSV